MYVDAMVASIFGRCFSVEGVFLVVVVASEAASFSVSLGLSPFRCLVGTSRSCPSTMEMVENFLYNRFGFALLSGSGSICKKEVVTPPY